MAINCCCIDNNDFDKNAISNKKIISEKYIMTRQLLVILLLSLNIKILTAARISQTLSRHPSLSFIAFSRSSGLHTVSTQGCCMLVQADRPAFARSCEGVHRSTSLMSLSLLLQQCPTYLVRLILIVFVMGSRWPYSYCFVGCCLQDLFNIARNILVWLPSGFSPSI